MAVLKIPGWLQRTLEQLEAVMFPHQESEEEQESLTDVGRARVGGFLQAFDENTFNHGFDAAIRAVLNPEALRMVKFTHPKYLRDRRAEYEKFRQEAV
jgi:hypothetical protein